MRVGGRTDTGEGSPPHREDASTASQHVVSRHKERTRAECDGRIRDITKSKKEALRLIDEVHGDVNLAEKGILRGLRQLSLLTKEEEAELAAREPYTFEDGTNGTAMPSIAEEGGR